jgi:hypothetical protein
MKNFLRILFLVLCPVLAFGQGTHTGGGGGGSGVLQGIAYGAGAGSVNVMTVTTVPPVTSNVAGTVVSVLANLANTTVNPTLNVGGAGAMTIVKGPAQAALVANDYNTTTPAIFISTGSQWQLINPNTISTTSVVGTNSLQTTSIASGAVSSNFNAFVTDANGTGGGTSPGVATFRGSDQTGATGAQMAGSSVLRPGLVTSTSGFMGLSWVEMGAFKGAAIAAAYDVVQMTAATAATVTDSATSSTSPIGIAVTTTNPIRVVIEGLVPINSDGTAVVGDTFCTSTTAAGQGHDSGGVIACIVGTAIGKVYAITGTYNTPLGSTVTATGTLPLVRLNMD